MTPKELKEAQDTFLANGGKVIHCAKGTAKGYNYLSNWSRNRRAETVSGTLYQMPKPTAVCYGCSKKGTSNV